ncbi:uncharacterized protein [Scyliorhinus torazame]|uniref:uncharacterized protein n=1 Tax=Scyliorhinus torazame TaxID=75743 RepID=UPI003B596E61
MNTTILFTEENFDLPATKIMYKMLQYMHHLTLTEGNIPKYIKKVSNTLINSIRPIGVTPQISSKLIINANNWAQTTQTIVIDHYKTHLKKLLNKLEKDFGKERPQEAFDMAKRWYNKNFRQNARFEIIEKTHNYIFNSNINISPIDTKVIDPPETQDINSDFEYAALSHNDNFTPIPQIPTYTTHFDLLTTPVQSQSSDDVTDSPIIKITDVRHIPNKILPTTTNDETKYIILQHPHTFYKNKKWFLIPKKSALIIGDSNLSTIKNCPNPNIQLDSFPRAKFIHITSVLHKLKSCPIINTIIFSIGIFNRTQTSTTAIKQLQILLKIAAQKFPRTKIFITEINFSRKLPEKQIRTIVTLNDFIRNKCYIPSISNKVFTVSHNNITWTDDTAMAILHNWLQYI